jgi:hypothetical protein
MLARGKMHIALLRFCLYHFLKKILQFNSMHHLVDFLLLSFSRSPPRALARSIDDSLLGCTRWAFSYSLYFWLPTTFRGGITLRLSDLSSESPW